MKRIIDLLANLLALFCVIVLLSSCKTDEPSPVETKTKLLASGTWSISYVKIDGVDRTELFPAFKITFADQEYTPENGGPIWGLAPLTWSFTDNSATEFNIGTGTTVAIHELTQSSLNVTLIWDKTTLNSGKYKSISGKYEFQFTK